MNIRALLLLSAVLVLLSVTPTVRADLTAVLRQLDADSPNLAAAKDRATAAQANLRVARSRYFGSASVFGNRTEYNDPMLIGPISPPVDLANFTFDDSQMGFGLTVTLPLDINRRIGATVGVQEHLSSAATHDAEHVRLFLFGRAVQLYRGLQELQGKRDALQSQQTALNKNIEVVRANIRVGRAPRVELLRIDAERKAIEGQLAALDGREVGLRSALAALLGRQSYDDAITSITNTPRALTVQNTSDVLQRPDVKAAERRVAAARQNVKRSNRDWLPEMQLQVNTMQNAGLSTTYQDTWSVVLRLDWELWDGGRRIAETDNAKAGLLAFSNDLASIRHQAHQELQTAVASWHAAKLQYESAAAGLSAAAETERIQSDRFQAGRISAADLIDAEAALANAMASKTSAMAQWWLADDLAHLAIGLVPTAYSSTAASQ